MTTNVQVFNNHDFGAVRTITQRGRVLFCGKDAATALGYANSKDALARHCKGVVERYPLETPGGVQEFRFITEGDLYRLIASSKLPTAQRFESWVFDEVLPSIRRHGMYAIDELLQNDEFLEEAIRTLRAERVKRLAAEQALCVFWKGTNHVLSTTHRPHRTLLHQRQRREQHQIHRHPPLG